MFIFSASEIHSSQQHGHTASWPTSNHRLFNDYVIVGCTRGHNFRLIKQYYIVNCYSNSFVGRTVNAWNSLPASAFDCESVSSFKHFLDDYNLSQFLSQWNASRDVVSCQSADLSLLLAVHFNFAVCLLCC